jgi:hypothetical protein
LFLVFSSSSYSSYSSSSSSSCQSWIPCKNQVLSWLVDSPIDAKRLED